ncbi:hypothetical protein HK104_001022 [Borealophlyctis nickersoniae]|nr:hypothetical protein HK104_001022 [Borealophlyctis nickersoniae]
MSTMAINYAAYSGISSVAAAAILAAVYVPLLGWFGFRAVRKPAYFVIMATVFSILRIVAFSLRAALAASTENGENITFFIVYIVFYSTGFVTLLFATYDFLFDSIHARDSGAHPGLLAKSGRYHHLIRLALFAAIGIGISGSTYIGRTSQDDIDHQKSLTNTSLWIFFGAAILALLLSLYNVTALRGNKKANAIVVLASVLLVTRTSFFISTIYITPSPATREAVWYPLAAVTELIALVLLGTLGNVRKDTDGDIQFERTRNKPTSIDA